MAHGPWTNEAIASLVLIGMCDTAQIVNVHHFEASLVRDTAFVTDQDAIDWSESLVDDWLANLKDEYLGAHTSDYVLNMARAQVLERKGQVNRKLTPVERPQSTANGGTLLHASENNQTTVNIKWRTPVAGKSHRGRTFLGPIPIAHMASGYLNTGISGHVAYKTYADAMIARYGALAGTQINNYRLTIYSKPYHTGEYQYTSRATGTLAVVTPPDYDGDSTNVTVATVDPILRTQRKRVVGVGS